MFVLFIVPFSTSLPIKNLTFPEGLVDGVIFNVVRNTVAAWLISVIFC